MALARVAGTPQPDASPEFWRNWRQLGQAVVARAIYDYCMARKKIIKDKDGFHYGHESYEKFFCSKYFSYICPEYDGHVLLDILKNGGWKTVQVVKRFPPTREVGGQHAEV